ncbi:MAG TPA: formyltransferase family protein [Allosphingosinicella sp.]|nr:formyltransferase family protein [Allosphingosinicella sp.]
MWRSRTLLITDPNLGEAACARVSKVCSDLTWLSWDVNRLEDRSEILSQIAASRWDLAISFYSDLILPPAALHAIGLPLNIHPALPRIRGVGHDIVPLVEGHATVGTTLHRMEPAVDLGEIFAVQEAALPAAQTYAGLRAFNQSLSLAMLDRLCELLVGSADPVQLEVALRRSKGAGQHWGSYYSRKDVELLRSIYEAAALSAGAGSMIAAGAG